MVLNLRTKYYGIWVVWEGNECWLSSDNGDERYLGTKAPTDRDIDDFRNEVM